MLRINILAVLFFLFTLHSKLNAQVILQKPSADQQKEIDQLKAQYLVNGELSLPVVLAFALGDTTQMRLIKNQAIGKYTLQYKANAAFDPNISGEYNYLSNKLENSSGPFAPESIRAHTLSLEARQQLKSGTSLAAGVKQQNNRLDYASLGPGLPFSFDLPSSYHESKIFLQVRQELLRNSFGKETRLQLEAAEKSSKAIDLSIIAAIEDWAIEIVGLYHQAWTTKKQYAAVRSQLDRQKRFYKVVQLKRRRGTAELADVLQIQASLLGIENQQEQARKALNDIWEALIINLGLPRVLLYVDPDSIPLNLTMDQNEAQKFCQESETTGIDGFEPSYIKALQLKMAASESQLEAVKSRYAPSLYAQLGLESNAIEDVFEKAFPDSLKTQNNLFVVGVGFNMFLDNRGTKGDFSDILQQKNALELSMSQQKDYLYVQRSEACRKFSRLLVQRSNEEKALDLQKQRNDLEARRFQIGRNDVSQVLAAEVDVINAELKLSETSSQISQTLWSIKKLHNQLESELKELRNKLPKK